jgi:hypothetical protein
MLCYAGHLLALANPEGGGDCQLLDVDSNAAPGAPTKVVATLPRRCNGGGLGRHEASGVVYAASEGGFLPLNGLVYAVDPLSGSVAPLAASQHSFANDGIFIDQARHVLCVTRSNTQQRRVASQHRPRACRYRSRERPGSTFPYMDAVTGT